LAGIERAGAEALASMRRMVGALRDDDGAAAPTAPAASLADLSDLAAHSGELGLPVRLHVDVRTVPVDVAQSVHRIVRESLTNARRHATGANGVDVHILQGPAELTVTIVDDGRLRAASSGWPSGCTHSAAPSAPAHASRPPRGGRCGPRSRSMREHADDAAGGDR
jgi:signal transduction histidine kinase